MTSTRHREPLMSVRTVVIVVLALVAAVGAGAATYMSLPSSPLAPVVAFCLGFGAWVGAAAALDQMIE